MLPSLVISVFSLLTLSKFMATPEAVDIIIIGGGSAGSVVAGRLAAADPKLQILIVEQGKNNLNDPTVTQPAMYLTHLAPTSTTAKFYTGRFSKQLGGRSPIVPVGNILGGGSSINFMMYTRASRSDYDDWRMPGWTANDLVPYFRKTENYHLANPDPKIHGFTGPLAVSHGGCPRETTNEFLQASKDMGYRVVNDLQNLDESNAFERWGKWIHPQTGRRSDAAHGFVHPQMQKNKNLHLLTDSKVARIIIQDGKATGIEYVPNTRPAGGVSPALKTIKARKLVVLSAGALGSPQVLERSGVGAPEILKKAGVKVVVNLPGVGTNYQDHNLILPVFRVDSNTPTHDDFLRGIPEVIAQGQEDFKNGTGVLSTNFIDCGGKIRPTAAELATLGPAFNKFWNEYFKNAKDKPVMFLGLINSFLGDHSLVPPGNYMTVGAYLEYPASRGTIHITSSDPYADPDFDPGFLTHEADIQPNMWGYKLAREVVRRMPSFRGEVPALHPKFSPTSPARAQEIDAPSATKVVNHVYSQEDDKALEVWVRENLATTWHSLGTLAMKPREKGGVVDKNLNVYGVKNLKVIDLSIAPGNVGSNTYSSALVIGERGAALSGEHLGLRDV